MIILESEWDEVAGVVEQSERGDSEASSARGAPAGSVPFLSLHTTLQINGDDPQ